MSQLLSASVLTLEVQAEGQSHSELVQELGGFGHKSLHTPSHSGHQANSWVSQDLVKLYWT